MTRFCVALVVLPLFTWGCADNGADGRSAAAADTSPSPSVEVTSAPDTTPFTFATAFGVGDVRAGMTLDDARIRTPDLRLIANSDSLECTYLEWPSAPAGVLVMFDGGRIARVDVDSAGVRTEAGVQVGDLASRVDSTYGDRVTKSPHKYTDGQYFTVAPLREADSLYRIVFEVENGRVSRFRVGLRPQVEYVEGCS